MVYYKNKRVSLPMGQLTLQYTWSQRIIASEEIYHKFVLVPFTVFSFMSPLARNNTVVYDMEHSSCGDTEYPLVAMVDDVLLFDHTYFRVYKLKTS